MKKLTSLLLIALFIIALTLCGCSSSSNTTSNTSSDVTDTTTAETTVAPEPEIIIDEAQAKEIVFADLCIQETAAQNLTVKLENNVYVIAFDWSGFDYKYTVDAATGEITEIIFDGEPLL